MQTINPSGSAKAEGLSHRAVLIHSLWLTLVGIILFRLGTANTQSIVYAEIFAASGAAIATFPWLAQFTVSAAAIFLYRAGACDLSWLVKLPSESMEAAAERNGAQGYNGKIGPGENSESEGFAAMAVGVSGGRTGPKLQRNRTV